MKDGHKLYVTKWLVEVPSRPSGFVSKSPLHWYLSLLQEIVVDLYALEIHIIKYFSGVGFLWGFSCFCILTLLKLECSALCYFVFW